MFRERERERVREREREKGIDTLGREEAEEGGALQGECTDIPSCSSSLPFPPPLSISFILFFFIFIFIYILYFTRKQRKFKKKKKKALCFWFCGVVAVNFVKSVSSVFLFLGSIFVLGFLGSWVWFRAKATSVSRYCYWGIFLGQPKFWVEVLEWA